MPHILKRAVAVAAAAAAACALPLIGPASPAGALPATITVIGHGYGHGRGMGQYGAYGYASADGWTYQQILAHYYGGTNLTSTSASTMSVSLSELYGASTVRVSAPSGQTIFVNNQNTSKTSATLSRGQTAYSSGNADIIVSGSWSTGSTRQFAGTVSLPSGSSQVVNQLPLQQYVEGVVPREMPASWSTAALEAQAVAVRTYALAYLAYNGVSAICDNSVCQNYGGDPTQYPNSYSTQSNSAVTATGNQVLTCAATGACGNAGQLAYTEYSASTGGYTTAGDFPAVVDAGDSAVSNPYHNWSASVQTSQIQSTWSQVGTLESIQITSRNGDGDWGGRVLQLNLVGTKATVTVSGATFASYLGLMSDWFTLSSQTPPAGSEPGYWVAGSDGSVFSYGSAQLYGSMAGKGLSGPVVGLAPTNDDGGYWLASNNGGVFSFGDAGFYGSAGKLKLGSPIVGMASSHDSRGYWMVAAGGGIFAYGDAGFYGSAATYSPSHPAVAVVPSADGKGYWVATSDGGIFSFGDAGFYQSGAKYGLGTSVIGMEATPDGKGYWLFTSTGGVYSFGDAKFGGSEGGSGVTNFVGAAATPDEGGYVMSTSNGAVLTPGDATWLGDPSDNSPSWTGQVVGIATS